MKIWIQDTKSKTSRNVRLQREEHSGHNYLGDLDDDELREFFLDLQDDIDVEKNMKMLKYYGYLHLFIIPKK